ncbi:hypothetical protein B0H12DRAFT_317212 [Mycena haematopus]|nr:hypothetical protein B0H12DRAFT_317212 [Mycena haematopus]
MLYGRTLLLCLLVIYTATSASTPCCKIFSFAAQSYITSRFKASMYLHNLSSWVKNIPLHPIPDFPGRNFATHQVLIRVELPNKKKQAYRNNDRRQMLLPGPRTLAC